MNQTKSISVVLPNYNGTLLLDKYLPTVYAALKHCMYISEYEVIIIDDASTDTSVDFIQTNYPDVVLLQNESNSGFSKTTNKGIFAAKFDLVLLLNTDMSLPQNIFDYLIPHFFSNNDIFGVSPTIKNESGNEILEAQKLPLFKNGYTHYLDNRHQTEPTYSFYLCGGCALIDREKLIELGGMYEIYTPFYFEDFDLSVRAWLRDWKSIYTPETYVLHCHSVTVNKYNSIEYVKKIFTRNKLFLNYLYAYGCQRYSFLFRSWLKFIWGSIAPSKSKRKFNYAFINLYKNRNLLKKIRKHEIQAQKISLKTVITKYFLK